MKCEKLSRVISILEGNGVVFVIGKRGSGKTTFCRLLALAVRRTRPVYVVDPNAQFTDFPSFSFVPSLRNFLLVVDDGESYFARGAGAEQSVLIARGRHADVALLVCVRRPVEVERGLTANADAVVAFQLTEPLDLDWMKKTTGRDCSFLSRFGRGEFHVFFR